MSVFGGDSSAARPGHVMTEEQALSDLIDQMAIA
jgi:hypothetical protein